MIPPSPDTRISLVQRLKDSADRDAWYEFVDIYRPVIYRLSRARGLQDADAEDLVQKVLLSVAGAIARFEPDESRGRFRTWLRKIADNAILNALARRSPIMGTGDTQILQSLDDVPSRDNESDVLRIELRREVFRWGAEKICPEFRSDTWNAFWLTAVEGQTVEVVAQLLGKSVGSVYAARSRVMRRMKEVVLQFEQSSD